jgi:hypothetical protein
MRDATIRAATIKTTPLRELTLDPHRHPRGAQHLSAASGLVCAHGRAYVLADDEHHLAVFSDLDSPGRLHRFAPGDLPRGKKARKRRKADMETLLLMPPLQFGRGEALLTLGSGSRPNRETGALIPLDRSGNPMKGVRRFDLAPLYRPLRDALGDVNIEGAFVIDRELLLLNRGTGGQESNAAVRYALRDLLRLIERDRAEIEPTAIRGYDLGAIDGVRLGFTDGVAMPGGGWIFSAVAEDTDDSVADGTCTGSAVGVVDTRGELEAMRRLVRPEKIEGIDLHVADRRTSICMVTDSDDPAQGSWLLLGRL